MNNKQKEDTATLEILQVIENKRDVTQRHIADSLGIALGLANSYLKRCVRKGLVKIHQAPANRYLYYLTPHGFAEKSRLTAEYLSHSFDFYRKSNSSIREIYQYCEKHSLNKVILCGASELAEIASLRAHEYSIQIVGILEPGSKNKSFLNFKVWSDISQCDICDAFVITAINDTQKVYELLASRVNEERILVPNILGIHKN